MELLSKKKKREPCFFLEKLFKIINNKKNHNIIHWNNDGTRVVISDSMKCSKTILPKYFNHENYSSFIRQLNIYGFHKINNVYKSNDEQFINENFKKNMPIEEIKKIRRKDFFLEDEDNNGGIINSTKKENKKIINEIKKQENDEKKIEKSKELIKNNNLNIMSNSYILEFLLEKSKENNDYNKRIKEELIALKNKNNAVIEKIRNMNSLNGNNGSNNNNILNDSNFLKINDIHSKDNNNNNIIRVASFTLNQNLKLLKCFQNDDNKIPKVEPRNILNVSFCEDLSVLVGYPNNNFEPQHTNSIFLNNSCLMLNESSIPNNNDITILKNNISNSFT